jgi:hypothetical protein
MGIAQKSYWNYSWISLKMEAEKSSESMVFVYDAIFQKTGKSISTNVTTSPICLFPP